MAVSDERCVDIGKKHGFSLDSKWVERLVRPKPHLAPKPFRHHSLTRPYRNR